MWKGLLLESYDVFMAKRFLIQFIRSSTFPPTGPTSCRAEQYVGKLEKVTYGY